jgi:UDP-N-acetylglucosamine 4,6-dehydratase
MRPAHFRNRVVLVTGGTGSFGRHFVRRVLESGRPAKVIVFSRDELKQLNMSQEIRDPRLRFFIGDVRDYSRLRRAFQGVDIVVHAAALKQVPSCEYNPFEAVKTNILGAQNIIDAAIDCGVRRVIALSTDKAVNPINLYGATKLVHEKLFVDGNAYAGRMPTRFSVVRYGNVVGSRGSVVPLFLREREKGVLPVTDERMTRFWITLERAVEFVVGCLGVMEGGEIFVPKIPSMRIVDLARAVAPRARLKVVGIRPGEKLHEVLISEDEARHTSERPGMFVIAPEDPAWRSPARRGGRPLPAGFRYASETNADWLEKEELRAMVGKL